MYIVLPAIFAHHSFQNLSVKNIDINPFTIFARAAAVGPARRCKVQGLQAQDQIPQVSPCGARGRASSQGKGGRLDWDPWPRKAWMKIIIMVVEIHTWSLEWKCLSIIIIILLLELYRLPRLGYGIKDWFHACWPPTQRGQYSQSGYMVLVYRLYEANWMASKFW